MSDDTEVLPDCLRARESVAAKGACANQFDGHAVVTQPAPGSGG